MPLKEGGGDLALLELALAPLLPLPLLLPEARPLLLLCLLPLELPLELPL